MIRLLRTALMAGLGMYGLIGAFHPKIFWPLDGANLIFHESGHLVFSPFGRFISMLGGTLMQLLVPAGIGAAFLLKNRDRYGACVMLWWFGQNFIHISTYARDARTMDLPLVGGGIHDWNYLLGALNLLPFDQEIASLIGLAGLLIMGGAAILGVRAARENS